MTRKIVIAAKKLWEEKKHSDAVRIGLKQLSMQEPRSSEQFTSLFLNLAYSLYSASELKLYNEFIKIFARYIGIIEKAVHVEPPIGYHNNACLMQQNLIATIFRYYFEDSSLREIKEAIKLLEFWTSKANDNAQLNKDNFTLFKLSSQIIDSKQPYFIINFRMPFSLPLPDGEYPIGSMGNIDSIKIESIKRGDLTSSIGDRYFSIVYVKIIGFTSTSNYWTGPSLENSLTPFNINLCLKALNEIIFQAKLINENIRLKTITHQDIGQSTTKQYDGEGEESQTRICMGYGGDSLVDALSKQELEKEEVTLLAKKIASSKLKLHEELFAEALIESSNEKLTSAFFLINSSCEALIESALLAVSVQRGKENEYKSFMQGRSSCIECELFKSNTNDIATPRKAMLPSLFAQLNFFKSIGVASISVRVMRKCLVKIRNDDLRNSLVHGKINDIPYKAVNDAVENYKVLQNILSQLLALSLHTQ